MANLAVRDPIKVELDTKANTPDGLIPDISLTVRSECVRAVCNRTTSTRLIEDFDNLAERIADQWETMLELSSHPPDQACFWWHVEISRQQE
ncbi:hypothetical protein BCR44DRAFT_1174403 [Catenaria anguillulae PL171]|uniref:Uncharacterized protein n=1 Tax=Catenaria anguillulae PL171 TaxID=765915 RepID=A0A1Y2I0P8_9FUNG|nr:hypothetical protein BCR44DRAFT_1174403 [Catenaria anguillulae PL171]